MLSPQSTLDPTRRSTLVADGAADAPSSASAVSWGAIFAGATAASALTLILLMLGAGLGLSSISPWVGRGASATAIGISAIVWITVTQLMASGMGGYLAGRLRTKWVAVHTDEVYFRDTAHGFMAWAVATLATAVLLAAALGAIVGGGVQAGAAVAGGATSALSAGAAAAVATPEAGGNPDASSGVAGYWLDSLFRSDASAPPAAGDGAMGPSPNPTPRPTAEVARIFANSLRTGALPAEDTRYVGQLVAQRTGLSQADAEKRVSDTYAKVQARLKEAETAARDAADKARKATVGASLWLFISLLIGAFAASLAATFGGRQRDL